MRYQLIGVNHNSAPLEVRERLAIPESKLPDTCRDLTAHPGIEQAFLERVGLSVGHSPEPVRYEGTRAHAKMGTLLRTT